MDNQKPFAHLTEFKSRIDLQLLEKVQQGAPDGSVYGYTHQQLPATPISVEHWNKHDGFAKMAPPEKQRLLKGNWRAI